jgi:hypothetical protein
MFNDFAIPGNAAMPVAAVKDIFEKFLRFIFVLILNIHHKCNIAMRQMQFSIYTESK